MLTYPPADLPPLKHPVAVIAHRGGRSTTPENTLAAFRNAINLGADYVEIDVRTTKDGHLVIMHDRTVDRTTNGKGNVKDLTLAEIRSLDAGFKFSPSFSGEKIPTFEETLQLCKGKINIYLDDKDARVEQMLAALRKYRMMRQVVIYNGTDGLLEWKKQAPSIPVMPTLPDEYRKLGQISSYLKILPAEVLDGNINEWTSDLVHDAQSNSTKVYVDNLGLNR